MLKGEQRKEAITTFRDDMDNPKRCTWCDYFKTDSDDGSSDSSGQCLELGLIVERSHSSTCDEWKDAKDFPWVP